MMDQSNKLPKALAVLLSNLVDGEFASEQIEELDRLLKDNPIAQQFYLDYISTHALLRQEIGSSLFVPKVGADDEEFEQSLLEQAKNIAEMLDEEAAAEKRHAEKLAEEKARNEVEIAERLQRNRATAKRTANRRPEPIVIPRALPYTVAAIVITSLLLIVAKNFPTKDHNNFVESTDNQPRVVLATVLDSVDAKWFSDERSTAKGSRLNAGPLELVRGVVEIEFTSGATLVVEAPAQFELTSDSKLFLWNGRLVGRVPHGAMQLVVETPSSTIIDLGTEFGVFSHQNGDSTDIHVFEGSVELQGYAGNKNNQEESPKPKVLQLEKGASALAKKDGTITRIANLNSERFVRKMSEVEKTRYPNGPIPSTLLPVAHDLALWLAADGIVKKNAGNLVSIWGDNRLGDNKIAENAVQLDPAKRPLWIKNGIGGRPSLQFDGRTTALKTLPLKTTSEQTVFCVVQADPMQINVFNSLNFPGKQILNYNGPPNLVLEWIAKPARLVGRVHIPLPGDNLHLEGRVAGPSHEASAAVVCGYTYSLVGRKARLYENGNLVGEEVALKPIAINSSKLIGAHPKSNRFFIGQLSELVIYNAALKESEISIISRDLMAKYGITN